MSSSYFLLVLTRLSKPLHMYDDNVFDSSQYFRSPLKISLATFMSC